MELRHLHEGRHYYVLDAEGLAAQAETTLVETIADVLAQAGVGPDAPALTIVHYLDPRVARRAAARAGIAEQRVVAPAEDFGHVAAGGIPIALAKAVAAGRVGPGDLVCCVAFGAGLCWGGVLLRL
jgi:3-oxoacyl-[acyl-carrier-protein] synthase-3